MAMHPSKSPNVLLLESEGKIPEREGVAGIKNNQSLLPLFPKSCPLSTENIQTNSPKTKLSP